MGASPYAARRGRSWRALLVLGSRVRGIILLLCAGIPCELRFVCSRPLTLREGDGVGVLCLFWVPACAGMTWVWRDGVVEGERDGGAGGIRTPDLIIANDALSQLSYSPKLVLLMLLCWRV